MLVLALAGTEPTLTYYKSGTFATESLVWPDSVDAVKKPTRLWEVPSATPDGEVIN